MADLSGKAALVTGAGRGIGKEIAYELASAGAAVVVNFASSGQGALELVERIRSEGGEALAVQADISRVAEVRRLVDETVERFGKVDLLVNNAAIDPTVDFFAVDEPFWDRVVDTNQKGAFFCAQACATDMRKRGRGRIVNISSVHGQLTMPNYAVYAATKGAMNALTRQLAIDLANYGITVNAVAPGAVEVEKFADEPWLPTMKEWIPAGRIGQPGDIARFVRFIASDESDYFTGQVVTVDGGSSARLYLPGHRLL